MARQRRAKVYHVASRLRRPTPSAIQNINGTPIPSPPMSVFTQGIPRSQASLLRMCSPTRMALAIAVSAGLTAPMLGKKLVSTT
jgi:hypothetical protein